jgi:asparaginyl-tRNA synthetase
MRGFKWSNVFFKQKARYDLFHIKNTLNFTGREFLSPRVLLSRFISSKMEPKEETKVPETTGESKAEATPVSTAEANAKIVKEKIASMPTFGVDERYTKRMVPTKSVNGILRIEAILSSASSFIDQRGTVAGWAKTVRKQANLIFVELSDGSSSNNLQIVCEGLPNMEELDKTNTGTAFRAYGLFVKSPAKGQEIELVVKDPAQDYIKVVGACSAEKYPLAKGRIAPEKLRDIAHLRPRSNLISAVARIRNSLAFATHLFFQGRGFMYIHTPIITASDCEGAGEMFQVTTILPKDLNAPVSKIPAEKETNKIAYKDHDFFKKPAFLTVSGQLEVETYCSALTNVYTFGPTFRAEESHTARHLAEFWMIEPEMAFADLEDNMELAEAYLKFCIKYVMDNNRTDIDFFNLRVYQAKDKNRDLVEYLTGILTKSFQRVSYTEGIKILEDAVKGGQEFQVKPEWGIDLGSEHERYIAEKVVKGPVILYNYPAAIKSFYMKENDDGKTVQAMDILLPQVSLKMIINNFEFLLGKDWRGRRRISKRGPS